MSKLPEQILMVKYINGSARGLRFPGEYIDKDFNSYVNDNIDVVSVETLKSSTEYKIYKGKK